MFTQYFPPKNHYSFKTVEVLHLAIISLTAGGLDKKPDTHANMIQPQHFLQANVQFPEASKQALNHSPSPHFSFFF